ncbi:MAG: cation:proton antiporter [Candidatus Binatus sp.]
MSILLWTLSLLVGAVLLAALARRIKVPSPSLFALGGVIVALLPHGPRISLQPDLALALFVAPVLMNAAFDSSLRDLRENWIPVFGLVFVAVALTTSAVALVARWLVPGMPWAAAIALGAAVAPPDAAAATAVRKEVRLPHRLVAILEDESLLNDASALLIYRLAVGAAVAHTGNNNTMAVASTLAFVLVGSIAMGALSAFTYANIVSRFSDVPSSIVMQFVGAFGIWILADRLALSGVLTVVTFAVVASRRSSIRLPAAVRVPSYAVWDLAVFVLNALAFILAGLQIGPIMDRLDRAHHVHYVVFATAILMTVILARTGWLMIYNLSLRIARRILGRHTPQTLAVPPFKRSMLASWCGMRGIVTLAAGLALPDGSSGAPAFPYRDLIVLTSFAVVLGTLVVQGLTLRALVMMLGIEDDSPVDNEVRAGRVEIFKAALESIDSGDNDNDVVQIVRREYAEVLRQIDGSSGRSESEHQAKVALYIAARAAARERLIALRATGVIGEAAFQVLEAELDLLELGGQVRSRW